MHLEKKVSKINKCLLSTYYVLGPEGNAGGRAIDDSETSHGAYILVESEQIHLVSTWEGSRKEVAEAGDPHCPTPSSSPEEEGRYV